MNHVLVFSKVRSFIVGYVSVAMMIGRRIWDLSIMAGGVNIHIPYPLWLI
jgi:hypothetical protein